jgi:hypothetical protein
VVSKNLYIIYQVGIKEKNNFPYKLLSFVNNKFLEKLISTDNIPLNKTRNIFSFFVYINSVFIYPEKSFLVIIIY